MRVLHFVRCKLHLHHWGPVIGDDWGAHQVCEHCGQGRRLGTDQPAEAHDWMHLKQ